MFRDFRFILCHCSDLRCHKDLSAGLSSCGRRRNGAAL